MIELTLIGVGLIGASVTLGLREYAPRADYRIRGFDQDAKALQRALELGVIDQAAASIADAVAGADVVILAVPMQAMAQVLEEVAAHLQPQSLLTDVGSVKGSVVAAARRVLGERLGQFVPGHPIAGRERSGVDAAFPSLFHGRRVILTPLPENSAAAVASIQQLWETLGATVECLAVDHHDQVLAETSHLPHVLAFALVDALARLPEHAEIFKYAAGGFRDFTRIASSDPTMWRDVCLTNRAALSEVLARYQQDLQQLNDMIASGDGEGLFTIFQRAKQARDSHCLT